MVILQQMVPHDTYMHVWAAPMELNGTEKKRERRWSWVRELGNFKGVRRSVDVW